MPQPSIEIVQCGAVRAEPSPRFGSRSNVGDRGLCDAQVRCDGPTGLARSSVAPIWSQLECVVDAALKQEGR